MNTLRIILLLIAAFPLQAAGGSAGRHTKGEKPLRIVQGQQVDLADFLVTQKITIFDFTSEYCPPCRAYAEPLLALHQRRVNLAVVKVDINRPEYHQIDWDSPVARQFGLSEKGLPYFRIHDAEGRLWLEGPAARRQVNAWIEQLRLP